MRRESKRVGMVLTAAIGVLVAAVPASAEEQTAVSQPNGHVTLKSRPGRS